MSACLSSAQRNGGNVTRSRWEAVQAQAKQYAHLIDVVVPYEDLVNAPNEVQETVAEALSLQIKHPWSNYPDFVPPGAFSQAGANYKARRIGAPY